MLTGQIPSHYYSISLPQLAAVLLPAKLLPYHGILCCQITTNHPSYCRNTVYCFIHRYSKSPSIGDTLPPLNHSHIAAHWHGLAHCYRQNTTQVYSPLVPQLLPQRSLPLYLPVSQTAFNCCLLLYYPLTTPIPQPIDTASHIATAKTLLVPLTAVYRQPSKSKG